MKILESSWMVGSYANNINTERDPKTSKVRDRLLALEKTMGQLTDAICTQGEKVAQLETKMSELIIRFNETVQECQDTTNLFSSTLTDSLQDT